MSCDTFGRSNVIGSLCSSGLESAYSLYPSLSKLLCLLELEEAGSEVNRLGFLTFVCEEMKFCVPRTCSVSRSVIFPTPMHAYILHIHHTLTHAHLHPTHYTRSHTHALALTHPNTYTLTPSHHTHTHTGVVVSQLPIQPSYQTGRNGFPILRTVTSSLWSLFLLSVAPSFTASSAGRLWSVPRRPVHPST